MTLGFSLLHFIVDGICAISMFSYFAFRDSFTLNILLYNFFAFAMQLPFGALLDFLIMEHPKMKEKLSYFTGVLGVIFTVIGAFTHPVILGIGNGLFHVGGGVSVINEDFRKNKNGSLLGIFVAPGALGLFLGTTFGKEISGKIPYGITVLLILLFLLVSFFVSFLLYKKLKRNQFFTEEKGNVIREKEEGKNPVGFLIFGVLFSFLVVLIRSFTGFSVSYPWKIGFIISLLATIMTVLGKMAGGIISAKIGFKKTVIISLLCASVFFIFKDYMVTGLLSILFFNMTMPLTLYVLIKVNRTFSGSSFGLLTFALFLGFLPSYFHLGVLMDERLVGVISSILSMGLLILSSVLLKERREK